MGNVKTYQIVRFFSEEDSGEEEVIKTGLSLEEAQEHCKNPETSSSTATVENPYTCEWFDGYRAE